MIPGHISVEQPEKLARVIIKHRMAFAHGDFDIGRCDELLFEIRLKDPKPFGFPYRHIPVRYTQIQKVKRKIQGLVDKGITRSTSATASAVVLVRKKTEKLRVCCDYRFLNGLTEVDHFPLP